MDMITGNSNGAIKALCIAYMFVFAIYTFVTQNQYMQVFQFSSIIFIIITMIIFILRIVFSIMVIFVAIFFIGVYLFLYSYLGIFLFSSSSFTETVKKIYDFMTYGLDPPKMFTYTECRRRTWSEWASDTGKSIVRNLTRYLFLYGLLFIFLYITNMYYSVLDNTGLCALLIIFNLLVMGYIVYYALFRSNRIYAPAPLINKVETALGVESVNEANSTNVSTFKNMFSNFFYGDKNAQAKRDKYAKETLSSAMNVLDRIKDTTYNVIDIKDKMMNKGNTRTQRFMAPIVPVAAAAAAATKVENPVTALAPITAAVPAPVVTNRIEV
jgi:hypothetical protein